MTSTFEDIQSRFLVRVTDYEFAGMDEGLAVELMNSWVKSVLSQPMVRKLFDSIAIDDDAEQIEYEMREPWNEETDRDFVEELIALGMVNRWLEPKYHTTLNISQFFGNSEQKFYSQSAHNAELKAMYTKSQTDFRKLLRDRAYNYSVVFGAKQ